MAFHNGTNCAEPSPFAAALRRFRLARRMSQLDLALSCGISARHVSFLETARARPSREMAAQLAEHLLLPRGAKNALLQAAGFAVLYPVSALDSSDLAPFRAILAELIARHAPNPALLCDRHWTILNANVTARALLAEISGGSPETNVVRLMTQSPRAPSVVANLPEVLNELLGRLQLEALEAGDDPEFDELLRALEDSCARYPYRVPPMRRSLAPFVLNAPGSPLRFHSAIAHFGTSQDVTVRDLRLELLFAADDRTRDAMVVLSESLADGA